MNTARASSEEEAILNALDLTELDAFAVSAGISISELLHAALNGDFSAVVSWFPKIAAHSISSLTADFFTVCTAVSVPAFAVLILKLLLGKHAASQGAVLFLCRTGVVSALAGIYVHLFSVVESLIGSICNCYDAVQPVLIAVITLCGAENAALSLTPLSALCAGLIRNFLRACGLPLATAAASVAIAGNLSKNIQLKRLQMLLKQLHNRITALTVAGFFAILSLQGRISAGRDGTAARTARYVIENIVPIIGGNVAGSLDSLLSAATVVRNAVGIAGLLLLCLICIFPLLRLLGMTLLLRLLSAIFEPLGDDALTSMTAQFSDAVEMLSVTAFASLLLCGILTGSCLWTAGGIIR